MNKKATQIYIIFISFSGSLLGLQMYLMARIWAFIPLIILIPLAIYYFGKHWEEKYQEKKKWAVIFANIFIALHILPLLLQLLTFIQPGIDNIILGSVGLLLFYIKSK